MGALQTIQEAQDLGIHIKMLTGGAVAIAKETCKQLQLGTNVYHSQRLIGSGMVGSNVRDFVETAGKYRVAFLFSLSRTFDLQIVSRRNIQNTNTKWSRCCNSAAT